MTLDRQSATLERPVERPPRMVHILDKADPEYPNRGLCGRPIKRLLPKDDGRASDCVVCVELDKTHDWHGAWKP